MDGKTQRQYLEDYLDDDSRALQDLLYEGRKIQAIKLMREKTGCGLKDAKERVEAVEAKIRERFPDALPAPRGVGCGTAALLFAILAYVGYNLVC